MQLSWINVVEKVLRVSSKVRYI